MAKILIIDDNAGICRILSLLAKDEGHDVMAASTLKEGLEAFQLQGFDIIFLDVALPDGNGLEVIPQIKKMLPSPEIIVMTGHGDPSDAETAIRLGAWGYHLKPLSIQALAKTLQSVIKYRENFDSDSKEPLDIKLEGVKSRSPAMRDCLKVLSQAAKGDANVLITGETGTGKSFFAKILHKNSSRADENFVVADCAALPHSLVEALLFGSEKGAYTDAKTDRVGLVEQADKGTFFLDEVGELPLDSQKAFLRVLDDHQFRRIGGKNVLKSNFRLISATNKNLRELVEKGLFRKDLFYRLHSFSIILPPLRECLEDIKPLAFHCMSKTCKRMESEPKKFSCDFLEFCTLYNWPGNIRELFNTMETIMLQTPDEPFLFQKHLPEHIRIKVTKNLVNTKERLQQDKQEDKNVCANTVLSFQDFRTDIMEESQKKYFLSLMHFTNGNINDACKISGLGRSSIYNFLKKHHINRTGWSPTP